MRATSSGIMAQQRPDAASNEPGKWLPDSQTVIQFLKRSAMVVGMRLSGKSPLKARVTEYNIFLDHRMDQVE